MSRPNWQVLEVTMISGDKQRISWDDCYDASLSIGFWPGADGTGRHDHGRILRSLPWFLLWFGDLDMINQVLEGERKENEEWEARFAAKKEKAEKPKFWRRSA